MNSEVWLADLFHDASAVFSEPQINRWKAVLPRQVSPGITSFSPVNPPLMGRFPWLKEVSFKRSRKIVSGYTDNPYVVIVNDTRPPARELAGTIIDQAALTIFDWSDDFVEFSSNGEERLICTDICRYYCEKADLVLTINDHLRDRALGYGSNAITVPNATNFFTFPPSAETGRIASKVRNLKGPVIGYIGWLNSLRLDLDLIAHVATHRPEWQFIFMGPKSEVAPLGSVIPGLANVHVWNSVPYAEYPSYLSAMDVCMLPNKISAHTQGNDPIKIYDYLASGNPVVTTRTAGTARFKEVVGWAEDKDQFLACLDEAVMEQPGKAREQRIALARQHSWQERITEVFKAVEPFIAENR